MSLVINVYCYQLLIDNSTHFITNDILYNNKFRLSFSGN